MVARRAYPEELGERSVRFPAPVSERGLRPDRATPGLVSLRSGSPRPPSIIFTGTSASAPIKGRATVSVGDVPCFSGSYTNDVCGRSRLLETDRCASATDQRFGTTVSCHLDGFSNPSASIQPGDSGGPVYDNATGGILAKGRTITSTTSTEGLYEEVLWQLRQWNVTLATS